MRWPGIPRVATAALALLLGLLGCEALLRCISPGENTYTTATMGILVPDPELGWALAPDLRVSRRWLGSLVTIRTDQEGRRVPATARERVGEQIAFAGDSYVFGNEVDAEETFVYRVGEALQAKSVNLGVGGYGLDQSATALARYCDRHADVALGVLVIYIGNDIEWGAHRPPDLRVDARGHLVEGPPGLTDDLRELALGHSRLLFGLHRAWRRWRTASATRDPAQSPPRWIYDEHLFGEDRLTEHRAVLTELRDRMRRRGVPVAVVLMPERAQVYGSLGDLPDRNLDAMLSELGLVHLDLLPVMRRAALERPTLWHDAVEGHLSSEGHRAVAAALIGWIEGLESRLAREGSDGIPSAAGTDG